MFPVGTTTVTCTASDPLGHHSSGSFTVNVLDNVGPIFTPVRDVEAEAAERQRRHGDLRHSHRDRSDQRRSLGHL
jgi:hypothetical protein